MPNIKSAAKRVLTAEKSRERNVQAKSVLKTTRKSLLTAVDTKDAAKSQEAYREYCSTLDKTAKKGIIGKNTAIRKKARAGALLRKNSLAK